MSEFPERRRCEDSEPLLAWLETRLQEPLPGVASHRPFAANLCYGRHRGPIFASTRQAAVLILLVQSPEGWQIPMTIRPAGMQQHAGQVCFPGGALEAGEDVEDAAKEAFEELKKAYDIINEQFKYKSTVNYNFLHENGTTDDRSTFVNNQYTYENIETYNEILEMILKIVDHLIWDPK